MIDEEFIAKVDAVITDIFEGATTKIALEKQGLKHEKFRRYLAKDIERSLRYLHAQEARSELMAEETLTIADTEPDPQVARNRIQVRQWIASKHNPKRYGDRIDLNLTQTVDIRGVLAGFDTRVLPMRDLASLEEKQIIDITNETHVSSTGPKPADTPKPVPIALPDTKDDIFS